MVQMGTYEELLESSLKFAELLQDINQHVREQRSASFSNQRSIISTISEKEDIEEEEDLLTKNIETKQEGTVKLGVYISYFRSGIGVVLGFILTVAIFSTHQVINIYSNWWLAAWSDDESRRYQNLTNCMDKKDNKTVKILKMNENEWNAHRTQRYYIFCG